MNLKDVADKYIEKYSSIVKNTSRIALFLLCIIIFSWIYVIEAINSAVNKNQKKSEEKITNLNLLKKQLRSRIEGITNYQEQSSRQYLTASRYNYDTGHLAKKIDSLETKLNKTGTIGLLNETKLQITRLDALVDRGATNPRDSIDSIFKRRNDSIVIVSKAKLLALRMKIDSVSLRADSIVAVAEKKAADLTKDVPFPFKTMFYFTNSVTDGPRALMLLITVLLVYVYISKKRALKYLSKAIRISKSDRSLNINKFFELNIPGPYWLAPLPSGTRYTNNVWRVQVSEIEKSLGWTKISSRYFFYVLLSLVIILGIETRLIYLSFHNIKGNLTLLSFMVLSLFVITIMVSIQWLFPYNVPDDYNTESNEQVITRRSLILFLGGAVLFSAFKVNDSKIIKWFTKQNHFRAKKKKKLYIQDLKEGIYINAKSRRGNQTLHYIDEKGYSISFNYLRKEEDLKKFKKNLSRVPDHLTHADYITVYIAKKNLSWNAEKIALYLIKLRKPLEAMKLLEFVYVPWIGNRLLDLLVKIHVHYLDKNAEAKNIFNKIKDGLDLKDNSKLKSRFERYEKPEWRNLIKKSGFNWENKKY